MVAATIHTDPQNFEAFIASYLDDMRHELIDAELIDLETSGLHVRAASPVKQPVSDSIHRKVAIDQLDF
jgi:hypothetical protein